MASPCCIPSGPRVLPSRGKAQEVGEHQVDLSDGFNRKVRKEIRYPALVWIHTNMIKNMVYDVAMRDKRLPDGADKQQVWPLNPELNAATLKRGGVSFQTRSGCITGRRRAPIRAIGR